MPVISAADAQHSTPLNNFDHLELLNSSIGGAAMTRPGSLTRSVTLSATSDSTGITRLDPPQSSAVKTAAALPAATTTLDLEAIDGHFSESPEKEKAETEKEANDEFYVEWEEGDVENPLSWTGGRRWYVTLLAASCVIFT